jgi:hypothetical protein
MKPALLKEGEIVVKQSDFGMLVENWVQRLLKYNPYVAEGEHGTDARLRKWWPLCDEYDQRHIQTAIEVAIELDKYPAPAHSDRKPLQNKELWIKFLADFRPPKAPYTIDYSCSKCKVSGVKLWRDYQTCADAQELLCAKCAAPGVEVDDDGRAELKDFGKSDQIASWKVPAVPVGDTYWGYTSVPSQDVEWWRKLPTYPPK